MSTNKFAARCTTCGAAVPPGAGVVTGDVGARTVTHAECAAPPLHARSFKVRSSELVPDLLVLPDARKDEKRRRLLGAGAAVGVVALAGLSVLLFTGNDNEGTTRTTGNLQPTTTVAQSSTSVATQVAGAVEQRPATTVAALPVAGAPATSAVTRSNEVLVVPPTTTPSTAPPATVAPTAPPQTAPSTVPPTVAPTTAPPTVPPTVAPTTTKKKDPTTTTAPPATTTTRRRGILGF